MTLKTTRSDIDRLVEAAKKLKHDAMHWTDFSKAFFHPRTVQVLDGIFETSSEGVKSFAGFSEGASWAMELSKRKSQRRHQKVGRRVRLFARVSCFCGRSFRIRRFMRKSARRGEMRTVKAFPFSRFVAADRATMKEGETMKKSK